MTDKQKGLLCAILGPVFWGVSGNVAQWLFRNPAIRPDWLVAVRLLGAGVLLMLWNLSRQRQELVQLRRTPHALRGLFLFGVGGVVVSQFTYFYAVKTSSAPTATILQFLGPVFIIIYLALRSRSLPQRVDVISIIIAFAGILLLVTHGQWGALAISPAGVFWGVGSGLGAALYTLLPAKLLRQFSAQLVTGGGMLFAALVLSPLLFLQGPGQLNGLELLGIVYVTVFGTLFAYLLYLQSMHYLRPTTVGMLGVFEPLSATIFAISFMGEHFGVAEVLGGLLVLSTTFLQMLPVAKKGIKSKV